MIEMLASVAVVAILAAILFPQLSAMQERSRAARCLQQQKSIGMGVSLFLAENNGRLPTSVYGARWPQQIAPYLGVPDYGAASREAKKKYNDQLRCPVLKVEIAADDGNSLSGTYGYHKSLGYAPQSAKSPPTPIAMAAIVNPSRKPALACHKWDAKSGGGALLETEGPSDWAVKYGYSGPTSLNGLSPNHGRICNVLFFDGHVAGVDVTRNDAWPWNQPNSMDLFQ